MSEPKLISPLLDKFIMGDPISEHHGIQCCPAISKETDEKYIVKVISVPESQKQVDALLLSGAFTDDNAVMSYYKSIADGIVEEISVLQKLSQLEGYAPIEAYQVVPKETSQGYDIYLLSAYRNTLHNYLRKTQLNDHIALNLGLDLCAALSVARRMGYMYVDLKPANIYLNDALEFSIGDIGFVSINSLLYTSLPERYRSEYTPPEIFDAYSSLNKTIDTYAVGLILYRAFNNGQLPQRSEEAISAPANADVELAEIILKACAVNPDERWQDPVDMGQALVTYMQNKGIYSIPIIPTGSSSDVLNSSADEATEGLFENNSAKNASNAEFDYEENANEVSDMLAQVDELIAHETPSPVVQPEPIDVPIPPIVAPEKVEETAEPDEIQPLYIDEDNNIETPESDDYVEDPYEEYDDYVPASRKRLFSWVIWLIVILIISALIAGGFWGYKNYYLQTIDDLVLTFEDGGTLIVTVSTTTNEKNLIVSCTDTYGNTRRSPVLNGTARFTGLIADSAYNVKVTINGFHKLKGETTASFATAAETEIQQLQAITGKTDGSVLLTFDVKGPDVEQWKVTYKSKDGTENTQEFTGHDVTVKGLKIGEEYEFKISPVTSLNLSGKNTVKYTAQAVVRAKNLVITGCYDGNLCVEWITDNDVAVSSWTVHCYNENFEANLIVKTNSAIIKVPQVSDGYTVEVTANNMSASSTVKLPKNTTTIVDINVKQTVDGNISIKWTPGGAIPENGFILNYTVDGFGPHSLPATEENSMILDSVVPGGTYTFEIISTNNVPVINGKYTFTAEEADVFTQIRGTGVTSDDLKFAVCLKPEAEDWTTLPDGELTSKTQFSATEKISVVGKIETTYQQVEKSITLDLIIRNEAGDVVGISSLTEMWNVLVVDGLFKLDISTTPSIPGNYSITLLINDDLAYTTAIAIVEQQTN